MGWEDSDSDEETSEKGAAALRYHEESGGSKGLLADDNSGSHSF
jgi:hypothetical protein